MAFESLTEGVGLGAGSQEFCKDGRAALMTFCTAASPLAGEFPEWRRFCTAELAWGYPGTVGSNQDSHNWKGDLRC